MQIVRYPHPALRHKARLVQDIDQKVRLQAGRMLELMYEARGLGLAGNQVAWPYQMFVTNFRGDPLQKEYEHVLINPAIVEKSNSVVEGEEGCLSFPGLFKKVRRAKAVKVVAYDLEGRKVELHTPELHPEISELASRVLQHEYDHLQGVLFIDKMGPVAKLASRGTLKEFEREFRRAQQRGEIPSDLDIEKMLDGNPPEDGTLRL